MANASLGKVTNEIKSVDKKIGKEIKLNKRNKNTKKKINKIKNIFEKFYPILAIERQVFLWEYVLEVEILLQENTLIQL